MKLFTGQLKALGFKAIKMVRTIASYFFFRILAVIKTVETFLRNCGSVFVGKEKGNMLEDVNEHFVPST